MAGHTVLDDIDKELSGNGPKERLCRLKVGSSRSCTGHEQLENLSAMRAWSSTVCPSLWCSQKPCEDVCSGKYQGSCTAQRPAGSQFRSRCEGCGWIQVIQDRLFPCVRPILDYLFLEAANVHPE